MKKYLFPLTIAFGALAAIVWWQSWHAKRQDNLLPLAPVSEGTSVAYFAGGCFWSMESAFEKLPGVSAVISGYSGGHVINPTYADVTSETSGHYETVEVHYDPKLVSYEALVRYFFAHIDPMDPNGQFVDHGESYRSAIFFQSDEERLVAMAEIRRLTDSAVYPQPIQTLLRPFERFYPAEAYHQDFARENPIRYQSYRIASGRDAYFTAACERRTEKHISCEEAR